MTSDESKKTSPCHALPSISVCLATSCICIATAVCRTRTPNGVAKLICGGSYESCVAQTQKSELSDLDQRIDSWTDEFICGFQTVGLALTCLVAEGAKCSSIGNLASSLGRCLLECFETGTISWCRLPNSDGDRCVMQKEQRRSGS